MNTDYSTCQGYRYGPEIISHAVWLYHLSLVIFRLQEIDRQELV